MRRLIAVVFLLLALAWPADSPAGIWMMDGTAGWQPHPDGGVFQDSDGDGAYDSGEIRIDGSGTLMAGDLNALFDVPAAHDFANATARNAYFDGTPAAAVDDYCHLQDTGMIQRCTVAGSPGTWVDVVALTRGPPGAGVSDIDDLPGDTINDNLIDSVLLDADLAAMAAIATTTYGRNFLSLADQAALVALLPTYLETETDPSVDTAAEILAIINSSISLTEYNFLDGMLLGNDAAYANLGTVVTDDTFHEFFAAISTTIGGLGGGHDAVTIAAGIDGLTLATQELSLNAYIEDLAEFTDPNADRLWGWDDSAGIFTGITIGSGLTLTGTTLTSAGGHDAVTLAAGVNTLSLSGQEVSIDTTVEQLADLAPVNNALLGYNGSGALEAKSSLSNITLGGFTASRAIVSDASGNLIVSAVTSTEIGYLDGVSSALQTQLDGKLGTSGDGSSLTGLDDEQIAFDDINGDWTATTIGAALEEMVNSINGGTPNSATAKVHWSQLLGVPAGFADGTDDGAGGSGSMTTVQENDVGVGGADIVTLDFLGADFDLTETPDTEVNISIAAAITRDSEVPGLSSSMSIPIFAATFINPDGDYDDIKVYLPRATTLTRVTGVVVGLTNIVGRFYEVDSDGNDVDAVGVETADWTFTTTVTQDTSFNNSTFDAGDWIQWDTTSVSGSSGRANIIAYGYET